VVKLEAIPALVEQTVTGRAKRVRPCRVTGAPRAWPCLSYQLAPDAPVATIAGIQGIADEVNKLGGDRSAPT